MVFESSVLVGLCLLSGVLSAGIALLIWRERPKTGATAMMVTIVGLSLWGIGQAIVVWAATLDVMVLGFSITVIGTTLIPVSWLGFGVAYTGRSDAVTPLRVAVLALQPLVVIGLAFTNHLHELVYVDPAAVTTAGRPSFSYAFGPAMIAHAVYSYAITLVGDALLFRKFLASRNVFRKRTFLFIIMSVSIVGANALSVAGVSPLPHFTLVPILFLGWGVVGVVSVSSNQFVAALPLERIFGLFSQQSKSLAPVARDTAIEELGSGFLVTDHKNRIVDINPMCKRILDRENERVVGHQLKTILSPDIFIMDDTEFLDPQVTGEYTGLWVDTGETKRCFDVMISALVDGDEMNGRVALVHDVTDREERKQKLEERTEELERQNEQLESFAGIVSHDLRNPLNVANGRLELIDLKVDTAQDQIDQARDALSRMEDIINDVLTLARLGQTVSDTEHVELGDAAERAWDNVRAPEATMNCDLSLEVDGDHGRLLQLFENLFRNAVEHGREDVTITVGQLHDGFYVEDDGPGIPEQHHDDVLEEGFTTSDEGTGFGLSIIDTITEAHGWDITVTTATGTGGARFEITEVIPPQQQAIKSTS